MAVLLFLLGRNVAAEGGNDLGEHWLSQGTMEKFGADRFAGARSEEPHHLSKSGFCQMVGMGRRAATTAPSLLARAGANSLDRQALRLAGNAELRSKFVGAAEPTFGTDREAHDQCGCHTGWTGAICG
jgi:hypothetical protein